MTEPSETKEARLTTIDGRVSTGRFEIRPLSLAERFKNGGKWLAIFWLAALPFIPIPFVHLFVPGPLIVAGIIAAVRMFRITKKIGAGEAPCPACAGQIKLVGVSYRDELKENCPKCAFGLKVTFPP